MVGRRGLDGVITISKNVMISTGVVFGVVFS